jgi:hypothetical protein
VTLYGLEGRGLIPNSGSVFVFSTVSRPVLGPRAHTAYYTTDTGVLSQAIKRQGCEADHSPPSCNYRGTANPHNSHITTASAKFFQHMSSPAVPWQMLLTMEILQLPR